MSTLRIFIAFSAPEEVRSALRKPITEMRELAPDVRWESPDKFHCTLKFLGDIPAERVDEVASALMPIAARTTAFAVTYGGFGAFPSLREPKVLWLGCREPSGTLEALKSAIDDAMVPLGFEAERRRFHPHLTLGRVKAPGDARYLTPKLENLTFVPQTVQVNALVVMKSTLTPRGSLYSVLREYPLQYKT